MSCYDEFALLRENAEEAGLPSEGPPRVERRDVAVAGGRTLSALVWGHAEPELVLLHGGAQNAHTYDTVALALRRPLVAIDLPGHGHSAWRDDFDYGPRANADDLAVAIEALAPRARAVIGMSLGGLSAIALAAARPDLVRALVVIDVTPGVTMQKAEPIVAFVSGPERFTTFDELLERTVAYNPGRTVSSLRRGVLHNARQQEDGAWVWRYDRRRRRGEVFDPSDLWEDLSRIEVPLLLVRGGRSGVVDDADVEELRRRRPGAAVAVVEEAGHSVQGDRPVELARIIGEFVGGLGDAS